MDNWQLFRDPRFALQFQYPAVSSDAETVEAVETQQEGMLRIHILAPQSREVYFEVTEYVLLSAEGEYQRHKEYLPQQFPDVIISELKETQCASLPAYEYTFQWDQGMRRVILVERGSVTYRIILNPRFAVNLQILSTVEWT